MYRGRGCLDSMASFYMFSTLLVSYTTNYPKRTFHPTHQIQMPPSVALPAWCICVYTITVTYFHFNIDPYQMLSLSVIKQITTFSLN